MSKITWTYEKRKIDDLIENKDNPRRLSKHKAERLKYSLEKYGLCKPLVVQEDGSLIGGHQRLRLLRSFGISEVDVSIPSRHLNKEDHNELTIILNKVEGEFDFDMLANRWDLDTLVKGGFTREELHSSIEPQQKKPKKLSINIKFEDEDDLRHVERELNTIICNFPSATMKVRCK